MTRLGGVILAGLIAFGAGRAAADPIDDIVASQMAVSHIPGAAVAVIDHGRVVKMGVYGQAVVEWSAPVGPDTRFQLASATKIFTGVLLMRLAEQGMVGLDDPLTRWFAKAPAAWSGITVRQLANHTSGLSEALGSPRPKTVDGIVAAAQAAPLAYAPGSEARYGFTDFTVLRAVLEKASGKSLPQLLQDEIVRPLGLRDTGFAMASEDAGVRTADVLPHRASIYGWTDGRLTVSDFFYAPQGYGAGGLYASIRDLAAFFAALDEGRLIGRDSLRAIETPAILSSGKKSGFGVGWTVRDYRGASVVGHSGGPALADILRVEDRQLTVIALTNQQIFHPLLAEAVIDTVLPPGPEAPALADDRPEIARLVTRALNGDRTAIAPSAAEVADQLASPFGQALLRGVGPLREVQFIGADPAGRRRYRVAFERKTMTWLAAADASGLVELRPE